MESAKQIIRQFVPVKTTSTFYQDGKITPEEFVAAGFYFPSSTNALYIYQVIFSAVSALPGNGFYLLLPPSVNTFFW